MAKILDNPLFWSILSIRSLQELIKEVDQVADRMQQLREYQDSTTRKKLLMENNLEKAYLKEINQAKYNSIHSEGKG